MLHFHPWGLLHEEIPLEIQKYPCHDEIDTSHWSAAVIQSSTLARALRPAVQRGVLSVFGFMFVSVSSSDGFLLLFLVPSSLPELLPSRRRHEGDVTITG